VVTGQANDAYDARFSGIYEPFIVIFSQFFNKINQKNRFKALGSYAIMR
jgi:hypothetical protein